MYNYFWIVMNAFKDWIIQNNMERSLNEFDYSSEQLWVAHINYICTILDVVLLEC